jgi:fatty acid desaturase
VFLYVFRSEVSIVTRTKSRVFAYSRLDVIPALAGVAHFAYVLAMFFAFKHLKWWGMLPLGFIYAVSISWNINGVSHNFLHNRFFRSAFLNRCFSIMESLTMGFSQVFYESVHRRHHMGNADLPDESGKTIDPLSIYQHGHDGEPENPWTYIFLSYFRDDPMEIFRDIKRLSNREAWWGVFEIAAFISLFIAGFIFNWRFMVFFLPFYYLGHCLSYLNGYYLHYGGNPDVPIAWGVSSYHKLYNWMWFNNGYHAEHHFRPRMHWTEMKGFHEQIRDQQVAAGVYVIEPPHALGFLAGHPPRLPHTQGAEAAGQMVGEPTSIPSI